MDVVVGDITGSQGASGVNLQQGERSAQERVSSTISGERQSSCRQACKGRFLAYLNLPREKVAILVLIVAEDSLVHVVVADVTGSQGASSVNLQPKAMLSEESKVTFIFPFSGLQQMTNRSTRAGVISFLPSTSLHRFH